MTIETKRVDTQKLLFDPNNPRLPEELKDDQKQIFRFLVDDIGVEDVVNSMAASGVIEADPMIVRPVEGTKSYYVIEGNRRLAALKLLNGEKIGDGKPESVAPPVVPEIAQTFKSVSVQLGWEGKKLDAYLGYKHVTAAREWAPEAKAKFVLLRCEDDFSDANLSKFAKRVGTALPTLRRWLVALLTLKQAEAKGMFDPEEAYTKRYFERFTHCLEASRSKTF